MSDHFIVYERDHSWQFTHRGAITAPFKTRDDAIAAAIEEARATDHRETEVIVQDKDLQQETIWRHPGSPA